MKDLQFRAEPLPASCEPYEWEWCLEGTRPGGSRVTFCTLPESEGCLPPPFVFLPGFRGRAHVTLFDISRDETAVVTSLGWYIFRPMLGVDFFVSDKDQKGLMQV